MWRRPRIRLAGVWALLARMLYWIAVLAVSLALVFLLLRFLEARDEPSLDGPRARDPLERRASPRSRPGRTAVTHRGEQRPIPRQQAAAQRL